MFQSFTKVPLAICRGVWLLAFAGLVPLPLYAGSSSSWESFLNSPALTGNWGGVRTNLSNNGITFFGNYTSMFGDNVSGGEKQTNTNPQQLVVGVRIDMAAISPNLIGELKFLSATRWGNSLSTNAIGNYIPVQETSGSGEGFRIVNIDYSAAFNNGRTFIDVGFLPLGDHFAAIQDFIHLQSSAFNQHAAALYIGRGWSDFPVGHWGGMVKQYLTPSLYGQIGAWDVNPKNSLSNHLVYFSTLGSTGVIIPAQFGFHTTLGSLDLPGDYDVGGYYDTSRTADAVNPKITQEGRFGGYAYLMQTVYKDPNDPKRSLSLFAEVVGADSKTASIPGFYAVGLVDKGIVPGRDNDGLYVGAYAAMRNSRVVAEDVAKGSAEDYAALTQYGEYGINVAYTIGLTRWLWVAPNLEYIINPGAFYNKKVPNATVLGVETSVTF